MTTLAALQSGQLTGARRLDLACGLTEFPPEIYDLADTLEVLNLSGNQLTALPDDFGRLHKLKIVFLSQNRFEHLPEVLSHCPQLSIVGFKANQIKTVSDRAFPPHLRWLILTDNRIEYLPDSLGQCQHLQKLMLAGNRLTTLPDLSACQNLELIRISANRLTELPDWLFHLPRLAWLAFAGNPCCPSPQHNLGRSLPQVPWPNLQMGELLGEGASGRIFQAVWQRSDGPKPVAVKLFKGQVTSDGLPESEMQACIAAGQHPNLVTAIAQVTGHPEGKPGLVLPLISPDYVNLGNPPSLASCTRDTYPEGTQFSLAQVMGIARGMASAAHHLHRTGILHGDFYPHNVLVNGSGHSLLGDFGAAAYCGTGQAAKKLERIEVRAFGYLLADLLHHCPAAASDTTSGKLRQLQQRCLAERLGQRPDFEAIADVLRSLESP
ncbi:MAG: leucine-rich repeat-containing protein kinase family protein [Cyanobacteria bacterium P01_A01_bin.135]